MKELVIASVILGLSAALSAAEAVPEYVTLTIRDGRVSGANFESARTPVVCTSLRGDVLDVDIRTEFPPGKSDGVRDRPAQHRSVPLQLLP